jgi:hypothetical protein
MTEIKIGMSIVMFAIGTLTVVAGLFIVLAKEYQETLKVLSSQSTRISGKALTDEGISPILQGTSQLLESVNKLVQTAVGVGAFLCLFGIGVCGLAFWMISQLPA